MSRREGQPKNPQIPGLSRIHRHFESWRRSRVGRERVPEKLWEQAVALARVHGVGPVSRVLRLDYYGLKKRMEGTSEAGRLPRFVEVALAAPAAPRESVLEIKRGDGAQLTVRQNTPIDLVAVSRAFLESKR